MTGYILNLLLSILLSGFKTQWAIAMLCNIYGIIGFIQGSSSAQHEHGINT